MDYNHCKYDDCLVLLVIIRFLHEGTIMFGNTKGSGTLPAEKRIYF